METIKVAFLQMQPIFRDKKANLDLIEKKLKNAEADLIVLPELATTGYLLSSRDEAEKLAEPVPGGDLHQLLLDLSNKLDSTIVVGFAEKSNGKVYNSALAVTPDGRHYVYRKTHLFYKEKELFDPGDTGFFTFEYRGIRIGMMICFDWVFPEAARELALKGAHIIAHPTNLVLPYCQKAMTTRCLENRLFAVTANRYGLEENDGECLKFTGESQITNTKGEILVKAPQDGDMLGVAEINPFDAEDKWITPKNHLFEDRRTEFYKDICS